MHSSGMDLSLSNCFKLYSSAAMPASSGFGDSTTPRLGSLVRVPTVVRSVLAPVTAAKPKASGFDDSTIPKLGSLVRVPTVLTSVPTPATTAKPKASGFGDSTTSARQLSQSANRPSLVPAPATAAKPKTSNALTSVLRDTSDY